MLKRLRIKFVCINMTIVTVMLCVIFVLVFHFTSKDLETTSIQMMQTIAASPFHLGLPNDRQEDVRLPFFTLQLGQHGEVLATGGGYYDLSDEIFLQEIIAAVSASQEQIGVLPEYNLRFCRVISPTSRCIVFADISSEQATLNNLIRTCLLIGTLSFLIFLAVSLLLAYWAVKPVDKAWSQQKQFVADASHELKTPLTVILTSSELLQSPDYSEAEKHRFAENIAAMSHQMRGLVESLLELARVDNGSVKMAFSQVDLSELVSDAVLPFEPVYFEQNLELSCQIEDGLHLKGSEAHLRQVVDILLDNAAKYTSPLSTVRVTLKKQGSHALLSVSNPGAAISQEDLKNIFKRFYRIDKARSMNHSYGLGLSIAESIVSDHRGKIWAESSSGINTFHVQLPL